MLGHMSVPEHLSPDECVPDEAPRADTPEQLEALLRDLEFRVKRIERDGMTPEELARELLNEQLKRAGFTDEQAQLLARLVRRPGVFEAGVLGAVHGRMGLDPRRYVRGLRQHRLFRPDCDEEGLHPRVQPAPPAPALGLLDALPFVLSGAMIGIGLYGIIQSRRAEPPPRPWWQRRLRRLVGVSP